MRFPRLLASLGNRFMLWQFRRGGARTRGGVHTLMLETVGAKSGRARQPEVTIRFEDGRRVEVRAETLTGDALAAAWERIADEAPEFVGYRSETDREIPVVRLRRR